MNPNLSKKGVKHFKYETLTDEAKAAGIYTYVTRNIRKSNRNTVLRNYTKM